jgi:hypothetical protein
MQRLLIIGAAALALSACARGNTVEVAGGEVATSVPADARGIPYGTTLHTTLDQSLSATGNTVGDRFTLTVRENLVAQNGQVVVPAGSQVQGYVTAVRPTNDPSDNALLQLAFDRITVNGRTYSFAADVRNVETTERRASTDDLLRGAAAGAAAGAVLGAIIGGVELDNILKGGAIGAAAGTVISMGRGGTNNVLPAGTRIDLRSTQNVALVQ